LEMPLISPNSRLDNCAGLRRLPPVRAACSSRATMTPGRHQLLELRKQVFRARIFRHGWLRGSRAGRSDVHEPQPEACVAGRTGWPRCPGGVSNRTANQSITAGHIPSSEAWTYSWPPELRDQACALSTSPAFHDFTLRRVVGAMRRHENERRPLCEPQRTRDTARTQRRILE
jgi:hypothetical protein